MKQDTQQELFDKETLVTSIGISTLKISGSQLKGEVLAVTNAEDLSQITPRAWALGVAQWLVWLCDGDEMTARACLNGAIMEYDNNQNSDTRRLKAV